MASLYIGLFITTLFITGALTDWRNLHVKFAVWDGYYDMPVSASEVNQSKSAEYVFVGHDKDLNVDLYSYKNDPRVFILFDCHGNIAGLRTGYIKADVAKRANSKNLTFPYNFDKKPMFSSGKYWNTSVWYTSVLFVSPEKLKSGGRNDTGGLVAEDIYVKLDGKWTLMPKDECKVEAKGFTKQACFLGMGMHYFYQMTPTTNCSDLQGVFLLYESGTLIGLGIIPFGSFTSKDRVWFEDPPASVVKSIVPNRPDCLTDWVTNYGTTSMHIFFKKYPRLTFCIWPWQKCNQCENNTTTDI